MKRSKFNILMALFVALILVPACGEDSNNQNPAEGEGEADVGEGEGEGEGNLETCEQCLQECSGDNCSVSCQALCGGEGEGEGEVPDETCRQCIQVCMTQDCVLDCRPQCNNQNPEGYYCELDREGFECQSLMTEDFLWFNGIWHCEEGDYCGEREYPTIEVKWWYQDRGVSILGFMGRTIEIFFQKDPDSGLFIGHVETTYGTGRAEANPQDQTMVLEEDKDFGSGPVHFTTRYRKQ